MTLLHRACEELQYETAVYLIENHAMNPFTLDADGFNCEDILNDEIYSQEEADNRDALKKLFSDIRTNRVKSKDVKDDEFLAYKCPCVKCEESRANPPISDSDDDMVWDISSG